MTLISVDMEGAADVMKQAITRAEKLDPDKSFIYNSRFQTNVFSSLQNR